MAGELAAAGEGERRLDTALVRALAAADLFRLCVPAALGGRESPPGTTVAAIEELARGDGAAGWCLAIGATSGLLAGYLPPGPAREVYGAAGSVTGGVLAPKGRAVATGGGFRVSGRWSFASGCQHCDWLMGGSVVEERDGRLRELPNGMPDVRLMLAPAEAVEIVDTWTVSGLRGTGSHDIVFNDLLVPADRSASVFSDTPTATGPLYAFPLFGLLAVAIAGVGLGIGRGALDDIAALAGAKTPTGSTRPLGQRATVHVEIARADAALRAARALLFEAIDRAWEDASTRGEVTLHRRRDLRLAATHAVTSAAEVSESAYRLGGGSAIYASSPLQRRFRDAHVATQHMLVAPATWELTGRMLLGLPTDATQL